MQANTNYVLGQVSAIQQRPVDNRISAEANSRKRDHQANQWIDLFNRMNTGELKIGGRAPIADTPVWATPEVLNGGFASGNLLASLGPEEKPNSAWTFPQLAELVESGLYRIRLPEHGALLVCAWLVQQGQVDECEHILTKLNPFMNKLRFYPDVVSDSGPGDIGPLQVSALLCAQTTGQLVNSLIFRKENLSDLNLKRIRNPSRSQHILTEWLPLRNEMFSLLGETMECQHWPAFETTESDGGKQKIRFCDGNRRPSFVSHIGCKFHGDSCGWPCQKMPDGWMNKAVKLDRRIRRLMEQTDKRLLPSLAPTNTNSLLTEWLDSTVKNQGFAKLTGRQIGLLRSLMAGHALRRGVPGSQKSADSSSRIQLQLDRTIFGKQAVEIITELIKRLAGFNPERGISREALESISRSVRIPSKPNVDITIPPSLRDKIMRSREDTLDSLLADNYISSGETMAAVIPTIVAETKIQKLPDIALQRLIFALRKSFNNRRSLLLLNLQSQVRIGELPWMQPLLKKEAEYETVNQESAKATLKLTTELYLKHFPQTIVPNKLLQSFKSLSESASLRLPFTEELASDIFMGQFTDTFVQAGCMSATLLRGTLYEKYYNLGSVFEELLSTDPVSVDSRRFYDICETRSGQAQHPRKRWNTPAQNGTILEQQQIITTHNLAALVKGSSIIEHKSVDWLQCTLKTWSWIMKQSKFFAAENPKCPWRVRLRALKDTAYAWRQLIFYLSMKSLDEPEYSLSDAVSRMQYDLENSNLRTISNAEKEYLKNHLLLPLNALLLGDGNHAVFLGWRC